MGCDWQHPITVPVEAEQIPDQCGRPWRSSSSAGCRAKDVQAEDRVAQEQPPLQQVGAPLVAHPKAVASEEPRKTPLDYPPLPPQWRQPRSHPSLRATNTTVVFSGVAGASPYRWQAPGGNALTRTTDLGCDRQGLSAHSAVTANGRTGRRFPSIRSSAWVWPYAGAGTLRLLVAWLVGRSVDLTLGRGHGLDRLRDRSHRLDDRGCRWRLDELDTGGCNRLRDGILSRGYSGLLDHRGARNSARISNRLSGRLFDRGRDRPLYRVGNGRRDWLTDRLGNRLSNRLHDRGSSLGSGRRIMANRRRGPGQERRRDSCGGRLARGTAVLDEYDPARSRGDGQHRPVDRGVALVGRHDVHIGDAAWAWRFFGEPAIAIRIEDALEVVAVGKMARHD